MRKRLLLSSSLILGLLPAVFLAPTSAWAQEDADEERLEAAQEGVAEKAADAEIAEKAADAEDNPPPVEAAQPPPPLPLDAQIKQMRDKEDAIREGKVLTADAKVDEARRLFLDGEYEKARDRYLESIELLRESSPAGEETNAKIDAISRAVADLYIVWAKSLMREAEAKADLGQIDEAVKLCNRAAEIEPKLKGVSDNLVKRFISRKDYLQFKVDTSDKAVMPGKEERERNADISFEQGKVLFRNRQYDKARECFEKILKEDPYNNKAIQYLRLVNLKIAGAGDYRRGTTALERIAEVEWKYLTPVGSRSPTGENQLDGAQPVRKEGDDIEALQRKLSEIIIDHIEFEEVSIHTVVKYLKQRSKELDPLNKGVNIVLRIEEAQAGGADKKAPGVAPEEGEEAAPAEEEAEEAPAAAPSDASGQYLITITVDNIPLKEAIDYICRGAGLKYRIRQHAVEIASPNVPFEELETRVWPMESETVNSLGGDSAEGASTSDVSKYFEDLGVKFPSGAKAIFDPTISRLIATNTPEMLSKMKDLIDELNKTVDPQVLVSAKFVEIHQNNFDELGFEWHVGRPNAPAGSDPNTETWQPNDKINRFGNEANSIIRNPRPDRMFGVTFIDRQGISYESIVHALNQSDQSQLLASPRVTTKNNTQATIKMVRQVYYPESWTEAEYTDTTAGAPVFTPSTPEFGEATDLGVQLEVTPNADPADNFNTIGLEIRPIVQEFVGWTDYSYSIQLNQMQQIRNVLKMPIIEMRVIETALRVIDGETVVMGGIIRDSTNEIDDRVPILGDVPLIGRLFRSKITESNKTNLLIFVTVRVVNPDGSPWRTRTQRSLPPFRM